MFIEQIKDFWYSRKYAGTYSGYLTEVLIDGEWYEYTEMITSGHIPFSVDRDLVFLGSKTIKKNVRINSVV